MKNRIPTKLLSFILSVLLIFYAIPSVIFAEATDAAESGEPDESDSVDASFLEGKLVSDADEPEPTESAKGQMSTITTDSTTYTFSYDVFGNALSTTAGSNTLATYTYNEKNGKLKKITYGNGFVEDYVYNDLEQLVEVYHTIGTERDIVYSYEYTASGQVHEFTDHASHVSTAYRYDTNGRLLSAVQYNDDGTAAYQYYKNTYSYNDKGQLLSLSYYVNHQNGSSVKTSSFSHTHTYNADGSLNKRTVVTPTTSGQETFAYDDYDRLTQSSFSSHLTGTAFGNIIDYTYTANGNKTSGLVQTYKSTVNNGTPLTYTYTYDNNGNITKIVYSTGEEIRYVYDNLGQLIREDNGLIRYTFLMTYDDAGNILKKEVYEIEAAGVTPTCPYNTINYEYSSSEWGDQLTEYWGHTITYDAIGNPLNHYSSSMNYTFSWTGRQLTGATVGGNTYSFTYNDEGIRTSKTKNDVTTTYYLSGSQIVAEVTNGNVTVYLYDAAGSPIGMQYHGVSYAANVWDVYWFEKNLQGDIVAVYNQAGTKLVSYTYDAWGNPAISYVNGGNNTTAKNNPFLYRGYYYDVDLDFYYLQSRYYDAWMGRFISPDTSDVITATPAGLTDKNLYAYCDNNPVMRRDDGGEFWAAMLIGAGIGILAQYISDVVKNIQSGETGGDIFMPSSSLIDYAAAGVGGAIAAIPGTNFMGSLVTGAAGNIASDVIKGNISNMEDIAISGLSGAIANGIGYKISSRIANRTANRISSMDRSSRKYYLTNYIFKNSRANANVNLRTFADNPVEIVGKYMPSFKYGIYSTLSSTSLLTTFSGIYGGLRG